jgi:hypothetical protein
LFGSVFCVCRGPSGWSLRDSSGKPQDASGFTRMAPSTVGAAPLCLTPFTAIRRKPHAETRFPDGERSHETGGARRLRCETTPVAVSA